MKPTFASERVTLARVRATGGALAKALRLGQRKRIGALDVRYRTAARSAVVARPPSRTSSGGGADVLAIVLASTLGAAALAAGVVLWAYS